MIFDIATDTMSKKKYELILRLKFYTKKAKNTMNENHFYKKNKQKIFHNVFNINADKY